MLLAPGLERVTAADDPRAGRASRASQAIPVPEET